MPQAGVEPATFRLGGGCSTPSELRKNLWVAQIDTPFAQKVAARSPARLRSILFSAPVLDMPYPDKPGDLPLMLAASDLQELWGVGRTTTYQRTQDPTFPEPLVFSGSSYRWVSIHSRTSSRHQR